ncbi:hypothetical protein LEP1GSC013_1679 [Leptospira interrogans serovar Valbuzzi str. Duyster]|nr:hypothetical protein LEP1GSC013_1679 [Leptospira interrogans serovar Valbuzzi str. Duyster]
MFSIDSSICSSELKARSSSAGFAQFFTQNLRFKVSYARYEFFLKRKMNYLWNRLF